MTSVDGLGGDGVRFDESVDVVVVGYGYAGGIAAIEAHDAGTSVLLLEKMPDPGGISILSGGAVRVAHDADEAFAYLKETNAGTTPDDVLRVLAEGMVQAPQYLTKLADDVGARVTGSGVTSEGPDSKRKGGNYPFPGFGTFVNVRIEPDEDLRKKYPLLRHSASAGGPHLFSVIERNVAKRAIDVRLDTPVRRLITDGEGGVLGVIVGDERAARRIKARRAVVLACGGFEGDEEMKRQYFQAKPVLTAASRSNTGDGIRMAQAVGAALWHMWHFHGSYAYKHFDPEFPYALRVKRLPDWNPIDKSTMQVPMVWILVDKAGQRFMNECPPYAQDTSHRPMAMFDTETQTYPRIPAFLICDERGRTTYRLGDPRSNDPDYSYDWSDDNLKEVENGILTRVGSIADLAREIGAEPAILKETIDRWNALCASGTDEDFGRPQGSMVPIVEPPFIVGRVWPTVSNTQGGPVHNARQQVMSPFGEPIPRLYSAGELGSSFGHLYLSGGNIAECVVSGRVAGKNAAEESSRDGSL
jgi:succinate dehydrogenase/fumarate reductase flavoprotein subunit